MISLLSYPKYSGNRSQLDSNKKKRKDLSFKAEQNNSTNTNNATAKVLHNSESKQNKFPTRKIIDALTVTTYAALIMAAMAIRKCRKGIVKDIDAYADAKKTVKVLREKVDYDAKIISGEVKKGGPLYRVFNYFNQLKENSAELTNNLVYGFGTLVIMPLVILFSPIGKKDASKEDRTFTVLRQPISFATVFAAQLTFDKIFKTLIPELNKHRLLDGVKVNGKELYFSEDRMDEALKEILSKDKEGKAHHAFSFNEETLNNKSFKDILKPINLHLKGDKKEFVAENNSRIPVEIEAKGNKFTLEEFTDAIVNLIKDIGDTPVKTTRKKIGNEIEETTIDKIKPIKQLLSHYEQKFPELFPALDNMAYSGLRSRALKESAVIIANSIASQALGIMMLNFIYGKMMKKYASVKQELTSNKTEQANGGKK